MNSFVSFVTTLASSYSSNSGSSGDDALYAILAAYMGIVFVASILSLAFSILLIVCQCKLFSKASQPWFAGLIPFWNAYVWCDMCFDKGWLFLLMFVPGINGIFSLYLFFQTARVFGRSTLFSILTIFFPVITFPILAFSSSEYDYSKATFLG